MPNTKSAAKALRQSYKKREANIQWKRRIKAVVRQLNSLVETKSQNVDILNKEASMLAKVLDKAAKNKAIHKNKANRLKSRYAKKLSAQLAAPASIEKPVKSKPAKAAKTVKPTKSATAKSKS